jgi:hypothetical protein
MDSIMKARRRSKSDNEAKKICKVITVGEKIKIRDKLRSDTSAAAVGLTFHWYVSLKANFPLMRGVLCCMELSMGLAHR